MSINKFRDFFRRPKIKNIIWLLGGLILVFLLHCRNSYSGDEGVILNGAWNLYNGRLLYRDFFEFIPPGGFYLIFGVWKIFGASFAAAKIVSILIFSLGIWGLYKITGRLSNNKFNWLVPLAFIIISEWWWMINHNTFNLTCLIWAAYFFIRGLDDLKKQNFIASGFLAGLAILFLQQKGLAAAAALFLFLIILLIRKKEKIYLKLAGLFGLAAILPLTVLLFWPAKTIIYDLIIYPAATYAAAYRTNYHIFLLYWLILAVIAAGLKIKKEKSIEIWFLVWLQVFLLASAYPLPDAFHIGQAIFPTLILIFYLAIKSPMKSSPLKFIAGAVFSVLLLSYLVIYIPLAYLLTFPRPATEFSSGLNPGNQAASGFNAAGFTTEEALIKFISDNCPGKYLYAGPFAPNLYFETRKLNATPYSLLLTAQQTPEQFANALRSLQENNPGCAVLAYTPAFDRFRHDRDNVLEKYIRDNYSLIYSDQQRLFIYKNYRAD